MTPDKLLGFLAESVYGQLVKNEFDAGAFQAYMENIKKLYDSGLATEETMGPGNANFSFRNMQRLMDVVMMPQARGNAQILLRPPGAGQDDGILFKSNQVLGLNAKSKAKDAAWSFVEFLLSEEMQSSMSFMSYPENKTAFKNKLVETQRLIMDS